jgi:hypothetical protein
MRLLFLALLLAARPRLLLDDTIEIPKAEWRYVEVAAREANAVVNCEFEVLTESAEVRAAWAARKDLELFRSGRRDPVLAATTFGSEGRLRALAPAAGDYAVLFENDPAGRLRTKLKVKVWMDPPARPLEASRERRLVVILISGIVFFGLVSFSAYKLRRAME